MKEAIIAKRIDLWLQVLALVIPVVCAIAAGNMLIVFAAYLSVGGVQVLSCLLNKIGWHPNLKHNGRAMYEKLLLTVLIAEGLALAVITLSGNDVAAVIAKYIFCALPFFSPFMAIWYMIMTQEELIMVHRISQRRVI
jgi:hypothetical protein